MSGLLGGVGDWAGSYYESEMEDLNDLQEDPVGEFTDSLQFGVTGPAPSLEEDLSVDFGPEPYGTVNETVWEATGGDAEEAEEPPESNIPWKLVIGVVLLLVVLSIMRPYASIGAEVVS